MYSLAKLLLVDSLYGIFINVSIVVLWVTLAEKSFFFFLINHAIWNLQDKIDQIF